MEYFDASLQEIIKFRKLNNWNFTEKELGAVLRDLSSGLKGMHSVGVVNRDIRPSTIWYVDSCKYYKFGVFSEAKFIENFDLRKATT
jgi:serine/threonine protein kinase